MQGNQERLDRWWINLGQCAGGVLVDFTGEVAQLRPYDSKA